MERKAVSPKVSIAVIALAVAVSAVFIFWELPRMRAARFERAIFIAKNRFPPGVEDILEHGDAFLLLSIDPSGKWIPKSQASGKEEGLKSEILASDDPSTFHGYPILGQSKIADPNERERLLALLHDGVAASDEAIGMCFNPRHGIRATLAGRQIDLVICFECLQVEVFDGDKEPVTLLTSRGPAKAFNAALKRAGLPIAP